jgi:two-component system sensor histidine kinase RpfC
VPRGLRVAVALLAAVFVTSAADWTVLATRGGLADAHPVVATLVGGFLILAPIVALLSFIFGRPAEAARLAAERGDGELQQTVLRAVITGGLLTIAVVWRILRPQSGEALFAATMAGLGSGAVWLSVIHFILRPARADARRLFALLLDVALLSAFLIVGNQATAPWFLLYLWLIFSHGHRNGTRWLQAASAASFVGFAIVVATTPVWRNNWSISVGLLLALALLPAYLATIIRRLAKARSEVQTVADARSRLFALTGEELRTPLGAIVGLAHLMKGPELNPNQTTMLDTIRSSAGAMLGMIDDLLDFSMLESGSAVSRPSAFDVPKLLEEVVALAAPEATRKGLLLGCRIDPLLPDHLVGHPIELRRMLTSLVSNAVRRTERGEVRLIVWADGIRGAAAESFVAVRFEIRDTGPELDAAALGNIFAPVRQEGDAPTAGSPFLSLAMVRELAKLMGGTVNAAAEPGTGSRFTAEIPMVPTAHGLPRRLESAAVGIFGSDSGLARILANLPVLDAMGVSFTMLGPRAETGIEIPSGYHLLIFDGRTEPVEALAAASRLGGRITRTAPATLVIANAGLVPHLAEMAPATVDTILSWPSEDEILVRTIGRLLGRAEKVSQPQAPFEPAPIPEPIAAPPVPYADVAPTEETPGPILGPEPTRRFRVLVAEDNQTNRIVLERILARGGHQVLHAHDGSEALSALEAGGIDAAILDLNMPELSGYHVAKLYRQMEPFGERLPLIGLTAEATSETERLCREAGMDAAIVKPVPAEDLLTLLARLVGTAPQQRRQPISNMVVTPITAHPKFAREATIIDPAALEALAGLGDDAFFRDVIDAFFADVEQSLGAMAAARAGHDFKEFKDQLHAMRSSAVNIGAMRLCQLIQDANDISAEETMGPAGAGILAKLRGEVGALRSELTKYTSQKRPAE